MIDHRAGMKDFSLYLSPVRFALLRVPNEMTKSEMQQLEEQIEHIMISVVPFVTTLDLVDDNVSAASKLEDPSDD